MGATSNARCLPAPAIHKTIETQKIYLPIHLPLVFSLPHSANAMPPSAPEKLRRNKSFVPLCSGRNAAHSLTVL